MGATRMTFRQLCFVVAVLGFVIGWKGRGVANTGVERLVPARTVRVKAQAKPDWYDSWLRCRTTTPTTDLMPVEPFQRCAWKALRGWYGPLERWQERAYAAGVVAGLAARELAKVTAYGDLWEDEVSVDCRGNPLFVGVCAAPQGQFPYDSALWIQGIGLVRRRDHGGGVRLSSTNEHETTFLDVYSLTPAETRRNVPWVFVCLPELWEE